MESIPPEYRHGIFAQPQSFKAWVRLSPGQSEIQSDRESHARGFAIKLLGVPGEKLDSGEKTTQDFILLHSPIFFTGDNNDYVRLIPNMDNLLGILDFRAHTYKLFSMMAYVAKILSWTDNPFTHSFYSTTPYRLGNLMAVKYAIRPCTPIAVEYHTGPSQMRAAIRATLDPISGQEVCYNFYVQKRVDPCTEPIEDPTIPWNTEMVHVARLTIPKQNFMYQDQYDFCESLSFNPWHSLAQHKPLGAINHVRKMVYEESRKMRGENGKYTSPEPTGLEKFDKPLSDVNFDLSTIVEAAGDTKHFLFQPYAANASDLDHIHIPSHAKGLPPGEEFEVSTFLALVMRMFVGDSASFSGNNKEKDGGEEWKDDWLLESQADGFWAQAAEYASSKISGTSLEIRLREQMGASSQKSTDVDQVLKNLKSAIFSKVVAFFKRAPKQNENQDFGSAIDTITTIFKKTSSADISKFTDPQEYETLFSRSFATDMPWVVEDGKWRRDDVYALQFIRGVNPTTIRRMAANRTPAGLRLDGGHISIINEHIRRLRPANTGESFESVMSKGEIFFAEYSILHGLHRVSDSYIHEPVIMFTLTTHSEPALRELMPIAIQFEDGRTFYPPMKVDCADSKHFHDAECLVWLFAKMHVMCADANVHESYAHLAMTHLTMEPIIVAARRQFAATHSIFKTLNPHFHQTIAINNEGRDTLINPEGLFQRTTGLGIVGTLQLINRGFQRLNWTEWTFPRRMERAGFPDIPDHKRLTSEDTLPGFLYRDFCYDLWDAMDKYMTAVVDTVYLDDAAILADHQLQAFAFEVSSPQFGNMPSFPSRFTNKAQLAESLALIAFTASIQHSAVNFGQFHGYGFVPNRPLTLTQPMPQDLSKLTMKYIMSALPNKDRAFGQMAVTFALSTPPEDTGDIIPLEWALRHSNVLSPAPHAFHTFLEKLTQLKDKFRAVTAANKWQYYHYVYPDFLAVSITI